MSKCSFHLYHISFLDSLLSNLKKSGASVDNLVSKGSVKHFNLNNPNTYLPIDVCYEFLENVKYQQGIDNIAGLYLNFKVGDLSDYGQFLSHCPDLLSILQNGIKYDHQIQTSGSLSLEIKGAKSRFSMVHNSPPSLGRTISEKINMAMFIEAFQFILGRDWEPLAIEVTTPDCQWVLDLLPNTKANIYTNSPNIAVIFKTSELSAKNPNQKDKANLEVKDLYSSSHVIELLFSSFRTHFMPNINDIADFFGCSRRTVSRKISSEGVSFQGLLQKHLFTKSLTYLNNEHLSIEFIAESLGYANAPNFIRAFKNWTSISPDQFRKELVIK